MLNFLQDGHCIYQKKKETQKTEFGCYGIWVLGMLEVACENVVCMLDVCMPDMYALYVCLICMPYMYVLQASLVLHDRCACSAAYVCLICMPYMYALYVCLNVCTLTWLSMYSRTLTL